MSSEEIQADAWEIETSDESWHDSRNIETTIKRHFTYVPAHEREEKQPLYSAETIQEQMNEIRSQLHFIIAHSDLDKSLQTGLEAAIEKTEVFSSDDQ